MPIPIVAYWADQLKSINSMRPKELTKSKITEIAKAALRAKQEYKHVVHAFEKFVPRCKTEHKLSLIYVLDSLLRTSRNILKTKDPFVKRFYSIFERIFPSIMECPPKDQMAIVRTVNLWIGNGIYTEEEFIPFKEAWTKEGIVTDVVEVERIVKGEKANMALYKHSKEKRRSHERPIIHEAQTPPGPPPPSSLLPDEQRLVLSNEVPEGGISEARFVELLQKFECDFGGTFSTDRTRLNKAHELVCNRLTHVEEERKTQHAKSIKKLLNFDYSDDEDEEGKMQEEDDPYVPMTLEERETLVANLLQDEQVREGLNMLYKEKMEKLAQLAREARQKNIAAGLLMSVPPQQQMSMPPPSSGLQGMGAPPIPNFHQGIGGLSALPQGLPQGLPPGLQQGLPQGLPQGLNPALLPSLPGGFPGGLPGMQNLQNPGQPNLLPSGLPMNLGGLQLPPNFGQLPPTQQGILPGGLNMIPGGIDIQQFLTGAPIGVPPPQMSNNPQLGNIPPNPNLPGMTSIQGVQFPHQFGGIPPNTFPMMKMQTTPIADEDLRSALTSEDRHRRKRSRSRDKDHKRSRRSRSRERKDRKSPDNNDDQKKKRKSGFPVLPTTYPESLLVVSRTLWFGRLPTNVTEKEINDAVGRYGKPTATTVIPPKACAFVTMENRKAANDVLKAKKDRGSIKIRDKETKMKYSLPQKITNEEDKATWDQEKGYLLISWKRIPPLPMMAIYFEGAQLDTDTLPPHLNGLIDEFGRPTQQLQEQSVMNTEGDMEISSPITHDIPLPAFSNMPSLMGLPPTLGGGSIPGINPLLLQQRALPQMQGGLPQALQGAPGLPPGMQGGLLGLHPGQPPLSILQAQPFQPGQNMGGMSIPTMGGQMPPSLFDNNRDLGGAFDNNRGGDMRGGFRGGRGGGRGGFHGDRGSFHGDRGGFRNTWNDRVPQRDDFRGADRRDRQDFRRDDRQGGDFRRGGEMRRRDWDNGRDHNRDFGRERSPARERDQPRSEERRRDDRREGGDRRDGGGRRRESRWGSVDDRATQDNEQPGMDHNGGRKHRRLPDESMSEVTSTTAEPDSAQMQELAEQQQ